LAGNSPEIYLPGSNDFLGNIVLRFTNFNNTSVIGTDVIPGSVQVWRSGIQDTNFSYNSSSGEVLLSGSVGQNEIIRITYLRSSEGIRSGSITAGFGAIYSNNAGSFSAQTAVGLRWNMTDDSYTDEFNTSTGTLGISARTAWDYDYLNAHIAGGFTFVQNDTIGLYRAAGMEGNELLLALPPETAFLSHSPTSNLAPNLRSTNRADLIFRNYYNSNILGTSLMSIDWNAPVIPGLNRPYPAKDPQLNGTQVLAAEFHLNSNENWTGFQVPVNFDSEILSRAGELIIPFRFHGNSPPAGLRLIIQIGALSARDIEHAENPDLIWERELYPSGERVFFLNDEDRQRLGNAKYLRLIAVYDGDYYGRILLAPPIVRGASFRAITVDGYTVRGVTDLVSNLVTTVEVEDDTLTFTYNDIMRRLHTVQDTQRVLKIDWEQMTPGISAGADDRVGELPLANYRELSFFVRGPRNNTNGMLHFIIASGPESIYNPQLKASIPLRAFSPHQWRKVTIRYNADNPGITVDNGNAMGSVLHYNPFVRSLNDSQRTSYIAFIVSPGSSQALADGAIYIDEIILEDAVFNYRMNAGASIEYRRDQPFLYIGGYPVLSDFFISTAVESELHTNTAAGHRGISGSMVNRTGIGFSLLDTDITGNISFTAAESTLLWNAEHEIYRTFGLFSVRETFYASPHTLNARHSLNLAYLSDFYARFDADAFYDFSRLRQRWNLGTGYRSQNELIPSVELRTDAVWISRGQIEEDNNYGELWLKTWQPLVPSIGSGADSRRTQSQFIMTQRTRPVGAILSLDGSTNFTGANNITRSEHSVYVDIPVALNEINFNFRTGRGFKQHLYFFSEDVLDDGKKFTKSIEASLPFLGVFPFYSLFARELNNAMDLSLENTSFYDSVFYAAFNDHFSARVNLPLFYNLYSFFIPSRVIFQIDRILEQKMDVRTDTLNLTGSVGFLSINMFGAMGYKSVFNFYQSDEFSHIIEGSVSIPRNEERTWRLQSIANIRFRGFTGGLFNIVNTFSLRNNGYWTESFLIGWETPTKRSLLSMFYDWITAPLERQSSWFYFSSVLNSEYEQLRRETLELIIDRSTDHLNWSIAAGHEEIIRILGRLNFTAFIRFKFTENREINTYVFNAEIGTTLRLIF
jgi:hypothetical protein